LKSWFCSTVHVPLSLAADFVGCGSAAVTGTNVGVAAGAVLAAAALLAALDVAAALLLAEAVVLAVPALLADAVVAAEVVAALLAVVVAGALVVVAAELVAAVVGAAEEVLAVPAETVPLLVDAVLALPHAARRGTAAASKLALRIDLRVIERLDPTSTS
jgi:hypothetical protein